MRIGSCPVSGCMHAGPLPAPWSHARRILARWLRARVARCLALVLVGITGMPSTAMAQAPAIRISPALIGESDPTFGIRGALDWMQGDDPTDLQVKLGADLPLTLDPDDNPESLEAVLSLSTLILDLSGTDLTGAPGEEGPNHGAIRIGIELGAEAPQRLDNADLAIGVVALYDHASPALWFVPGVELAYDLAACVGCDVPDADDNTYHRVDVRADWSIALDPLTPDAVEGFRLRPAGRWFHAWGVGPYLSTLREDDGLWGQIQLAYHTELSFLHEVYVSWRSGDLPVRLEEERAWSFGVTLIL